MKYFDKIWFCPHCHAKNLDTTETILLMCDECDAVDLDWSDVLLEDDNA